MIKSVTVINHLGRSLTMELRSPEKSGFLIRSITGLGPVNATVNVTEIMSSNGAVFNSSRLTTRNIVFDLQFLWAKTIEEVRYASYQWFSIGKKLTLIFETDERTCQIDGWVESNEPDIFSQEESAQISILCPDPYFYAVSDNIKFSGIEQAFEFPFENTLGQKELIFGNYLKTFSKVVMYDGDADSGLEIHIHANGPATGRIAVHNESHQESLIFDNDLVEAVTGAPISEGDDIVINTNKGKKTATLTRGSTVYKIFSCLTQNSEWITLKNGRNVISVSAGWGIRNLDFEMAYRTLYEGV